MKICNILNVISHQNQASIVIEKNKINLGIIFKDHYEHLFETWQVTNGWHPYFNRRGANIKHVIDTRNFRAPGSRYKLKITYWIRSKYSKL